MKKAKSIIGNLDTIIAGISLIVIVVITLAGVIMRRFLNRPIAWLEEMQLFFFVYTIFFGGSVAFRYGSQICIDLIANRLKGVARKALDVFDLAVTLIVMVYYAWGGYELMMSVTKKVTPYFKINYAFIDLAAPLGLILMGIQYTLYIVRKLKGLKNLGDEDEAMEGGEEE